MNAYVGRFLLISFISQSLIYIADGTCSFPNVLQSGTWHSSDMGNVTFNSTHFVASEIVDFENLAFECIRKRGDRYYMLSETFTYLGHEFKVSMCFKLYKQSNYKYHYYPMTSVLANTDVNRIFFQESSYQFSETETCEYTTTTISRTRVLIKEGYANVSTVDCPVSIYGRYTYNVSGSSCSDTYMDVCTNRDEVKFDYTVCSEKMSYSVGGALSCVWKEIQDDKYYTLLYNQDATTDEVDYFRYTCLVSRKKDDGYTYVTTYPRACLESQNVSAIDSPGVSLILTANRTCSSSSDDSTSTLSAGAAAAIVIALLILLGAAAVVGIWYYIKVYRHKKVAPDVIAAKSPPIDTKEQERLDGRVSPFSPYPTVSELAVYRFGPSPGPEIDDDDGGMTLEATTPGFTDGRRTMYGKDPERESQVSLPVYSEVGGETPEPTRLSEVHTRMSEISEVNIADPTPFTMTRATMNIPEETRVSPLQTPTEGKPNGDVQSPRDNGNTEDVAL